MIMAARQQEEPQQIRDDVREVFEGLFGKGILDESEMDHEMTLGNEQLLNRRRPDHDAAFKRLEGDLND